MEKQLPIDWLNDIPATRLFYELEAYQWQYSGWEFENIELYVIEIQDLLRNKIEIADKMMLQYTDRSSVRDFDDVESIIDKMGCDYESMEDLENWFKSQGIRLTDYPNVYDRFQERIDDDGLYWPDGHI